MEGRQGVHADTLDARGSRHATVVLLVRECEEPGDVTRRASVDSGEEHG